MALSPLNNVATIRFGLTFLVGAARRERLAEDLPDVAFVQLSASGSRSGKRKYTSSQVFASTKDLYDFDDLRSVSGYVDPSVCYSTLTSVMMPSSHTCLVFQ